MRQQSSFDFHSSRRLNNELLHKLLFYYLKFSVTQPVGVNFARNLVVVLVVVLVLTTKVGKESLILK